VPPLRHQCNKRVAQGIKADAPETRGDVQFSPKP